MKALVLAGGRGQRLEGISTQQNKCMLTLNGRPVIENSLNIAARDEIDEVIIVVGYRAEDIINNYGNKYKGKSVRYVIQREQHGLVDAIECSRKALGNDDFILLLGDEILINPRHKEMMEKFRKEELFGVCGVAIEHDRTKISKTYAILSEEKDNRILRLIEKPRRACNDLMGLGNCIFKNEILTYIELTPINQQRSEKELPDLIQCAIDEGHLIKWFRLCDRYININCEEDLKEAEQLRSIM